MHQQTTVAPAARIAHGDGLLAERQAAICTARRRASRARSPRSPAGSASSRDDARAHQRVHRRRLRQQDSGRAVDGDSGAAVEEAERPSGDDAHLARRRDLHRPHPPWLPGLDQDGLQEGRPRHRDRRLHRRSQRPVSPPGRSRDGGQPRVAAVSRRRTCASAACRWPPTRRRASRSARRAACRRRCCSSRWSTRPRSKLGIDQVAIRKINAPEGQALFGLVPPNTPPGRPRNKLTSCFVKEALDQGAELFNWEERKKRSGQRTRQQGDAASAVATGAYTAGSIGVDGLLRHQARRQAVHPPGHRQPRHALGDRHRARHRRSGRHAVGELRGRLGQHRQGRARGARSRPAARRPTRTPAPTTRRAMDAQEASCRRSRRRTMGGIARRATTSATSGVIRKGGGRSMTWAQGGRSAPSSSAASSTAHEAAEGNQRA